MIGRDLYSSGSSVFRIRLETRDNEASEETPSTTASVSRRSTRYEAISRMSSVGRFQLDTACGVEGQRVEGMTGVRKASCEGDL